MCPYILFKNKSRLSRRKKELIGIILISSIILSTIFFYTYIINNPIELSNFPTINITTEEEIKFGEYVQCTIELDSKDEDEPVQKLTGRIKIRGHTNAKEKIPKKEFRLELNQRKSLLGMRKDDDWLLLAMYFDFPRMRIKLSMDLWRSLEPTNPTAILPDSEYVGLYLNGKFQGLYLLSEEIDRRLYGLDDAKNNIDSSLIFQLQIEENFTEYHRGKWDQDWPNEEENIYIMDEILPNLISFVTNTTDNEFFNPETGIYALFDKLNLIDFFLFNYFILHGDFWNTNYYIVRNSNPNKFFLVPWDFDGSLGQRGWTLFDSDENPENKIFSKNELYRRLLNNEDFKQECKNRWIYLRDILWTEEFILNKLSDIYKDVGDLIEIDTTMWKPITVEDESLVYNRYLYSTKEFDLDEYVNNLFQFIPERLAFCDQYFLN